MLRHTLTRGTHVPARAFKGSRVERMPFGIQLLRGLHATSKSAFRSRGTFGRETSSRIAWPTSTIRPSLPLHQSIPSSNLIHQRRSLSFRLPAQNITVLGFCVRLLFSSILGIGTVLGVILIHDSFTYSSKHIDRVPTSPLALHPRTGGPKGLPVVDTDLGDSEDEVMEKLKGKPRLLIVGGGWGVSSQKPSLRIIALWGL